MTVEKEDVKYVYLSEKLWDNLDKKLSLGYSVEADSHVEFSDKFLNEVSYATGYASLLLSTAYSFSRKQKEKGDANISVNQFPSRNYVLELVRARLRSKDWANIRAD